jgi:hypothetical protein
MSSFEEFQADSAPAALQHPRWRALTGTLGAAKDVVAQAARDAAKVGLAGDCPEDSLGFHARERSLERYPTESASAHRARLVAAAETLEFVGTVVGLGAALTATGYGTPKFYVANGPAPTWWVGSWPPASEGERPPQWVGDWPVSAGNVAAWPSRFWVELAGTAWQSKNWGESGPWGAEEFAWGSSAPVSHVALVKRIIKRWRPAHCVCIGVFVELQGGLRNFWPTWPHEE